MAQQTQQTGDVITLSQHEASLLHPSLTTALHYWEGLCDGQTLPARDDVEPNELAGILSNIFILERTRPNTLRLRLGGAHLSDLMGMEVRGLPIRSFFELSDRTRLMTEMDHVFERPAKLVMHLTSDMQGQGVLEGQMMVLPLTGPSGRPDRALGVIATRGSIGLRPRRFRIKRSKTVPWRPETAANSAILPSAPPPRTNPNVVPRLTLIRGGAA